MKFSLATKEIEMTKTSILTIEIFKDGSMILQQKTKDRKEVLNHLYLSEQKIEQIFLFREQNRIE